MGTSAKIAAAKELFETTFPDKEIINHVVSIVDEVLIGKWPDDTLILPPDVVVGDIKGIKGFYLSDFVLSELVNGMQGRAFRGCCLLCEVNLHNPRVLKETAEYLMKTEETKQSMVDALKKVMVAKYGAGPIDEDKVFKLQKRRNEMIEAIFGPSMVVQ